MAIFHSEDGVELAHEEGLVIALVPSQQDLERALQVVEVTLSEHEHSEPGICGQLVLHPRIGVRDLTAWANEHDLANRRISVHLAEDANLELDAQRRFDVFREALDWARRTQAAVAGEGDPMGTP